MSQINVTIGGQPQGLAPKYTVSIGQQITLNIISSNVINNVQWTLPGNVCSQYPMDINAGGPVLILENALNTNPLTFYWTAASAEIVVSCQVTTNAGVENLTAKFQVTSPRINPMDLEMFSPILGKVIVGNKDDKTWIGLVGNGERWDSGIEMAADLEGSPTNGRLAGIQLVNTSSRLRLIGGLEQILTTNGSFVLDTGITNSVHFQNRFFDIAAGDTAQVSFNDGPRRELNNAIIDQMSVGTTDNPESFIMYLVFRPTTPNSIWVPIYQLRWSWWGKSEYVTGAWNNPPDRNSRTASDWEAVAQLPQWNQNIKDGTWVNA